MARPEVHPVTDDDLGEFTTFLKEQFGGGLSSHEWQAAFEQDWCADKPNNGFLLRDGPRLVGVIGAIYADREIRGKTERFCNITAWTVLEEYRMHSMRLATALMAQTGFHFTDLTPTKTVRQSLQFLKFKEIDARQLVVPNPPSIGGAFRKVRIVDDPVGMEAELPADRVKVMRHHLPLPWIRQVVLVHPGGSVHVVYKVIKYRGLPCALVMAVSDRDVFARSFSAFRHDLLVNKRLVCTRLERRFLGRPPLLNRKVKGAPRKLFHSSTLEASDIDNLYSELVAVDLPADLL